MKNTISVFLAIFVAIYIWAIGGALIVLTDILDLDINDGTGFGILRIVTWHTMYEIVYYVVFVALDYLGIK